MGDFKPVFGRLDHRFQTPFHTPAYANTLSHTVTPFQERSIGSTGHPIQEFIMCLLLFHLFSIYFPSSVTAIEWHFSIVSHLKMASCDCWISRSSDAFLGDLGVAEDLWSRPLARSRVEAMYSQKNGIQYDSMIFETSIVHHSALIKAEIGFNIPVVPWFRITSKFLYITIIAI